MVASSARKEGLGGFGFRALGLLLATKDLQDLGLKL